MKTNSLKQYIDELNKQYKTGIAREHSYRPALKDLLQSLLPKMVVTNEPAQKWLKDRKGLTLSFEDVKHYQRIIYVLQQTGRLMQEIDDLT